MSEVNQTVLQTMGEAATAASTLIEQCVDHAVTQLQEAESHASGDQRQRITEAWRALLARRSPWSTRLPKLLAAAFQAEAIGQPLQRETDRPADDEDSTLSLVDDTELARTIEAARLAQHLGAALERPLAELDALMSSALGLSGIQPERNPLRPAVYAQVLRAMMADADAEPEWPGLWLRHMSRPLAEGLGQVYRDQAQSLLQQRVNAASYRVRMTPSAARSPGGSGGTDSAPAPLESGSAPLGPATGPAPLGAQGVSGFAELSPQQIDAPRLHQFLTRGEPQANQRLSPNYYAQVEAELRALQARQDEEPAYDAGVLRQQMHVPAVDRAPRPVHTDSPLPPSIWGRFSAARERALVRGQLKAQAQEVGQVFGLEVVRRLVNRVADDPRLLGPVREAIVGLEPALLRLALVAPRFFSDADHPGRLLVERVAERSFKYNDEFSVEFQGFFGPVAQGFLRLNQIDPLENAEPFRATLATLQAGWAAQDALDEDAQREVLAAVEFAERRQQDADVIANEFRQRPDLEGVTDEVRDFLLGTWALVVAHARLAQPAGGVDPGGHIAVVSDLLWSVKRELALHEPAKAFAMIPRIVMKIRSGLAMIGQQPEESAAFFHALEVLHRPVLKLRARKRHGEMAPPEPMVAAPPAGPARAPGQPWMAPREMHVAGFEDKLPAELPHAHGAAPAPESKVLSDREAEQLVDRLAPGAWVDLYSRQQWRRARLKWASDKRTLFMFVSQGGRPHSMTRRSIERLLKDRMLRPVDSGAVVPRALAQLGQQAAQAAPA